MRIHQVATQDSLRGRTRLVGADDIGTPEGLDRGERADDGVLLGHLLGAEGEAGGDDHGETFGDGSHGQRDGDLRCQSASGRQGKRMGTP